MRLLIAFVLTFGLAGCATLRNVVGPTTPYTAAFCATGSVPIACRPIGKVNVPDGGLAFVQLALSLAGPMLDRHANLKSCLLTSYPPVVTPDLISVTATAVCKLNGVPVQEDVTVQLAPVRAA